MSEGGLPFHLTQIRPAKAQLHRDAMRIRCQTAQPGPVPQHRMRQAMMQPGIALPRACATTLAIRPQRIKPLRFGRLEDGTLTLEASTTLARERVTSQYADRLRVISSAEFGAVRGSDPPVRIAAAPHTATEAGCATQKASTGTDRRRVEPRYTFANFIVGKPMSWPPWRVAPRMASVAFNPLLMAASVLARRIDACHCMAHPRAGPDAACRLFVGGKFVSLCSGAALPRYHVFKEQFRSVDVLMIDDVQFISGGSQPRKSFSTPSTRLSKMAGRSSSPLTNHHCDLEGLEKGCVSAWGGAWLPIFIRGL